MYKSLMPKPIIGITTDAESVKNSRGVVEQHYFLKRAVADAVSSAGGEPAIIPFCSSAKEAKSRVERMDGLLVSGGNFDIHPSFYGEKKNVRCGAVNTERTKSEMLLLGAALVAGIPVLGICGGAQLINVFFGGTLYQDIPSQLDGALAHSQKKPHRHTSHAVKPVGNSLLSRIVGKRSLLVNSTHHQSVKDVGNGLVASAAATDGVIEAVETENNGGFVLGVQWHPEFLTTRGAHCSLFKALVRRAAKRFPYSPRN